MLVENEEIRIIEKNDFCYIEFKALDKYKHKVKCIYSLKDHDVDFSRKFHPAFKQDILDESYRKLEEYTGIKKERIAIPVQTHTDNIRIIDENSKLGTIDENCEIYQDVDSLITDSQDINLALTYADCTPIIIYDPVKNVIANVHSGWKGTYQEIGTKTALKMISEFECNPQDLIVIIGPCIMQECFEVDENLKNQFAEKFNYVDQDIMIKFKGVDEEGNNKYLIDTTYINYENFKLIGVKEENIHDADTCTMCNHDRMHSYRYDNNAGRNICVIGLK